MGNWGVMEVFEFDNGWLELYFRKVNLGIRFGMDWEVKYRWVFEIFEGLERWEDWVRLIVMGLEREEERLNGVRTWFYGSREGGVKDGWDCEI